jgi:hypothetical protein
MFARGRLSLQRSYDLRKTLAIGAVLLLSGCVSDRHFAVHELWPFGNPNGPASAGETAQRSLGHSPVVAPMVPQSGNVWPGPVQPMPTLSEVQKNSNLPLGQGYTPSLPSPYPPGEEPKAKADAMPAGALYLSVSGVPQVVPAVPGDAR